MFNRTTRIGALRTLVFASLLAAGGIALSATPRAMAAACVQETVTLLNVYWEEPRPQPGDILVFTGRLMGNVETFDEGCALENYPIQQLVIIDPGGQRPAEIVHYVVVGRAEPIQPGTRFTVLEGAPNLSNFCRIVFPDGIPYFFSQWRLAGVFDAASID